MRGLQVYQTAGVLAQRVQTLQAVSDPESIKPHTRDGMVLVVLNGCPGTAAVRHSSIRATWILTHFQLMKPFELCPVRCVHPCSPALYVGSTLRTLTLACCFEKVDCAMSRCADSLLMG